MPDLPFARGEPLTIGQMAQRAGLPTSTVRYYERIGLLQPENRSGGNYRIYSDKSLRRVRFIRAAQSIGFTLDDVKALFGAQGTSPSCVEVQSLLGKRLAEIEARLKDLRHVQRVLKQSLRACLETEKRGGCQVLDKVTRG